MILWVVRVEAVGILGLGMVEAAIVESGTGREGTKLMWAGWPTLRYFEVEIEISISRSGRGLIRDVRAIISRDVDRARRAQGCTLSLSPRGTVSQVSDWDSGANDLIRRIATVA